MLWADHGYNRPATHEHAEQLKKLLKLNTGAYVPARDGGERPRLAERRSRPPENDAAYQGIQRRDEAFRIFPARHEGTRAYHLVGALRGGQNPNCAGPGLHRRSRTKISTPIKVRPVFYWSDAEMEAYLKQHHLPERMGLL